MNTLELTKYGFRPLILASAVIALAACGGGSSTSSTSTPTVTSGVITGFGSVCIGDVKFDDNLSSLDFDDSSTTGTEGGLHSGMPVSVIGSINPNGTGGTCTDDDGNTVTASRSGTALEIVYDNEVKGPITVNGDGTLDIFGQTIVISGNTIWNDNIDSAPDGNNDGTPDINDLTTGDFVEVGGFPSETGEILATYIEREDGTEVEIKGVMTVVDADTFTIGATTIEHTGNETELGLTLSTGTFVEVEGTWDNGNSWIVATEIKAEDDDIFDLSDEDDEIEVEGLVTSLNCTPSGLTGDFEVNGICVDDSNAEYENGTNGDLVLFSEVDVEGNFNNDGVLVATEVEFDEDEVRVTAAWDSINQEALGLSVITNNMTELEAGCVLTGGSAPGGVEIRGMQGTTVGEIVAKEIKCDSTAPSDSELRGPVNASPVPSDPQFSILGVTIDTTSTTCFSTGDNGEPDGFVGCWNSMTATAFYSLIQSGGIAVEAKGNWTGSQLNADEVEIETED